MTVGHIARTVVTFRDARGFTAQHRFYVDYNDGGNQFTRAGNIYSDLAGLSFAAVQRAGGAVTTVGTDIAYGTASMYPAVQDKLEAVFITAEGAQVRYLIPAPKRALFLADGATADPGNGALSAWAAAIIANHACAAHGGLIVRFVGGRLVRSRKPSRLSSYTLRPDFSGPDW